MPFEMMVVEREIREDTIDIVVTEDGRDGERTRVGRRPLAHAATGMEILIRLPGFYHAQDARR